MKNKVMAAGALATPAVPTAAVAHEMPVSRARAVAKQESRESSEATGRMA